MLPLQQHGEPSLLYPSPPTPRPNVPVAKAKGDDLPPPPPPNYPPPKAKSSEGGGSGAGKGAGASPVITIDDPSSGGPSSGGPSSGGPPIQVPPVADDPLKAAGPCGPPPLPNRPKRPVDQMMASSSAGISGGCSQASQSKKYLAPTSKGGGDSSGKATAPEVVVPKFAGGQGHQVNPSAPSPAPVPIAGLNAVQKLV